nr:lysophospholipid acyltransferase family protein [Mesorhizobium sp. NBSH29]
MTRAQAAGPARRTGVAKGLWKAIRKPLAQSRFSRHVLSTLLAKALSFIKITNPLVKGSSDLTAAYAEHTPSIVALWHGQHILVPAYYDRNQKLVAMFSRSADAELNAMVFEKLGFRAVRGSGGRPGSDNSGKGGAQALIALKKALDAGNNVAMIADIAKGTPRDAGLGIVTLAKLSGRPILPVAMATSRRKVLEKSWDKTTVSLPFGRGALIIGDPISVPSDATDAELEARRREVTDALNMATEKAYQLVDRPK